MAVTTRWYGREVISRADQAIINWMDRGLKNIQRDAKKNAPADTGNLRKNIHTYIDKDNLVGYVGILSGIGGYAGFTERGTRRHFLPFDPLKYPAFVRWAVRHHLYKEGGGLMVGGYDKPYLHWFQRAIDANMPKIQAERLEL